ncbi:unnamed protein product [Angiostrongylus costaricensis]|uniref:Cytoplasmic dynein 2 heavy chain 1 n=1 Tax=Angiostrongylus costaricensis TaxID=334426 RepID=A0A0R3PIV3_ANGCS|nr:unnamed protein product [Angiostrongylus costaricensis]
MSKEDERDVRRTYLLRVASHILGLSIVEEKLRQLQAIDAFCDTNVTLLTIRGVDLSNTMKSGGNLPRVVFYKTRPMVLTTDNYKSVVNVMSMIGTSNEVFLKSVQNVKSLQTTTNKHLLSLVSELEENLLATVDVGKEKGEGGVVSLLDEIRVWKSRTDGAAQQYRDAFEPIQHIIDTIDDRSVDELITLVEAFEDCCDALWNSQPSYPETRMRSLIQCMGSYLCEQLSLKIDPESLWKNAKVTEELSAGIACCGQWELSVQLMTGQTWKRQADGPWQGEPVQMKYLQGFKKRLEEVLSLKQLGPQIALLLNEPGIEAEVDRVIETAMRNTAVLAYNPFTENIWKSRMLVTEKSMDSIIDRTIPALKSRLQPDKLERNHVGAEIPVTLIRIDYYIARSKPGHTNLQYFHLSLIQLENMQSLCSVLLDDLASYPSFNSRMKSFMDKLKQAEQESYDEWCRETIQSIDDTTDSIALETTGRIMVLEKKNGTLNVNYSDRLLKLLKEVRQLSSLGLKIPSKIVNCANQGEKFYRFGVLLKQIAHFYNTIDQQMLPCQQALMLDEAIAFERLVISKKNEQSAISHVTWEDPKQLEDFIAKLQLASDKLSNHNRRLRNAHTEIVHLVMELVNLDLLKEVNKWKEILVQIRSKISTEELLHGATKANLKPWQIHWNWQLYKALQLQYKWGIESLHTQIPVIHTQLVFAQKKLQLRPPIEEIRVKYYKEMRKLLSIPLKFKGVLEGEQSTFFSTMLADNADRFPRVYVKAEQLMRAVEQVDAQFADWLFPAQVDLELLIEETLKTASDWEAQLKLVKAKGREAAKLPNEIRLDCIVVSTTGAKTAIDELLQHVFETLIYTLRISINTKLQNIQQFLTQAIDVLSSRPQSIDEVAEANARHMEYGRTNRELKASWAILNEQHILLRSAAGSSVEQMMPLTQQWEKFEMMLDNHQMMIKEQVEVLKTNVTTRVAALNDESEKLAARWNQFKPKSGALQGDRFLSYTNLLEMVSFFKNNWVIYEEFNTELQALADEEWIVFRSRTYLFDEFLQKWLEKLKTSPQTHMGVRLLQDIDSFKEFSGCLKFCRGEVLSIDHWLEMFRLLQLPRGTTLERLRFGDLIAVSSNVIANVEQLKALNSKAQGEITIREAIQELEMWAAQLENIILDFTNSNPQFFVKDSQALLQSLKNSPFYAQFSDKTSIWETRLSDLDVYLPQMNDIQRKWVYLEPIFGRGALPAEASRFARVDSEFRLILNIVRDARLVSLCSRQSLRKSLEQIIDQLNRCQKALNQFLEEKRSAFPRFYFLGDDDLLEILGQSTNPSVIQSHLKKLFQGIDKVVFGSNNGTISAIVSTQGEHVHLSRPVRVVSQVEVSSKLYITREFFPTQALDGSKDLANLKAALQEQLKVYASTKVDDVVLDLKLKALILDIIHHIDITDQLINNKASSSQCWTWQRQLRFYLVGDKVVARQVNSEFDYTYEYQGNTPKLVHTPLTDKCYLTLTQAMYMGLGGNPYGPAGTGKTESVKALASLFGRQVLVFNCDEGIDVHSMSRIFIGIVQCGAWGCFDEFNRLDQTVLSAVSMQIQTIQDVIKSKSDACVLGGKTVRVNPNAAIFITLNPAGKGYGGRQKMPDNLKQLFRPVVMSVPDNEVIAETILYSEGFTDARNLARKIVTVFKLSKEMLSVQQHYDWGLRALKVVLRGCSDLRAAKPNADETETVVQALLLNTLSKLTFSDSKRFSVLINDVFSSVNKELATFGDLIEPLKSASNEMNIELTDKQLQKVFQLYEQLRQRIGVVVVGPTGTGKSTIWRLLKKAQLAAGVALRTVSFNPKAMNRMKLLGHMDIDTREWSDGILTMAAREVIKDTSVHTWIIFDGDVDPEWIEALNSVLDDNRLLTMPSGERIQFDNNVNFLFETDSLQFASPATVSRMGMIFVSEEDISVKEVVAQWVRSLVDEHPDLPDWIDEHFYRYEPLENFINTYKSKQQFLVGLYRGLSSVIDPEKKREFANSIGMKKMVMKTECFTIQVLSWLSSTNRQPFLVVGPDGCGKEELLKHCFAEDNQSQLAIVHSSAQSRASSILQCLLQHCVQTSSPSGRVLRPKDKPWLILYLKSIDLPAPDKYGTNEMLAFLHQLLTYEGYYDEHLDWIGLENVQVGETFPIVKNHVFVTNGTVVPSPHNVVGLPLIPHSKHDYLVLLQKALFSYSVPIQLLLWHPFIVTNFLGGSVLLAGRPGLGRADAIRLIANMHEMTVFTPRITPNYRQKQFDVELKSAIQTAISNNEHVVFLLEHYKILRPQFLQAVNGLICSGDVTGLFSTQELDALSTALRDQMSQDGFQCDVQQYFAHRVRTLLHVGLVLDTDSTEFEARIAENPAIFKQSNVIWQDSWGRTSVLQVWSHWGLLVNRIEIHAQDFLFFNCLEFRTSFVLKAGVSKLTEAREQVALMQKMAATKSKLLAEKQADADEALKDISKSMTGAEDQKTSMQQLRAATEEENTKIAEKKKKIEEQLKDVEPLLKEARSAVGSIKPESLSEIRSLRAPPEAIRDILQAVLLFMGILDTSWEAMRKFLSKSSVKDEIINFDAHRITGDVHKKVSALVQSKQASFDPKNAKRASVAAAPLAAWVTANLQYSAILEKISPLEQEKNELISNLSKAEKQIQKLSKGLLTVDEKVAALKEKFEGLMKEATQIKIDLEKEQATIAVAGTLVDRLAGEFSRWQIQMESLTREMDNVESCSIITAAFVTYLGGCSEKIRTDVLKTFQQNSNLNNFSPVAFCAMETEQLNWRNHGLPADSLSVENTVIIFNGSPTPLIIDPTGRVATFLHSFIQKSELLRAAQSDLFTQIEFGIRFGKTIIVDDVSEIDATLVPIFRRELSSQGPRQVITFADKQIDYHPDFKLFLCTKNEHIVIPSSIRNVLSEVNFTTTRSGLTSQLLGLAIQIERPELEEKSSSLARDTETKKMELENLEQLLLQQLASSEENLLGNAVLLNSLNKSKENAETISRSIMESEKLHKELADQRNAYLSLAEFASSLYFVFCDLHLHNHMYNFNVTTIINIFRKVITECQDRTSSRIETLMRSLQLAVFYHISRALFKADRLMFALSFIHGTLPKMFQAKVKYSASPDLVDCESSMPPAIEQKITPFQKVLVIQATRPDRLYSAMLNFVLKTLSIPSINPPPFDLSDVLAESSNREPVLLILAGGADPSQELEELASKTIGSHKFTAISMGQGQEQVTIEATRRAAVDGQWLFLSNVHLMLIRCQMAFKSLSLKLACITPHEKFRLWMTTEEENRFPAIMLQQCLKTTFEPPPGIRNNLLRTYSHIDEVKRSVLVNQIIFVLAWLHALLQERRTFIPQAWTKFYEFSSADVRVARMLIEGLIKESNADWEFIRGLLKFVIYGGRIENSFDGQVLDSYLSTLFTGEKITGRSGKMLSKGVELLAVDNMKEIQKYVATSIPSEDDPSLFGLPMNIRYSWQLTEAEETVSRMRMSHGGKSPSDPQGQWLPVVVKIWGRLWPVLLQNSREP